MGRPKIRSCINQKKILGFSIYRFAFLYLRCIDNESQKHVKEYSKNYKYNHSNGDFHSIQNYIDYHDEEGDKM